MVERSTAVRKRDGSNPSPVSSIIFWRVSVAGGAGRTRGGGGERPRSAGGVDSPPHPPPGPGPALAPPAPGPATAARPRSARWFKPVTVGVETVGGASKAGTKHKKKPTLSPRPSIPTPGLFFFFFRARAHTHAHMPTHPYTYQHPHYTGAPSSRSWPVDQVAITHAIPAIPLWVHVL